MPLNWKMIENEYIWRKITILKSNENILKLNESITGAHL
jgi:hypothetical protein